MKHGKRFGVTEKNCFQLVWAGFTQERTTRGCLVRRDHLQQIATRGLVGFTTPPPQDKCEHAGPRTNYNNRV